MMIGIRRSQEHWRSRVTNEHALRDNVPRVFFRHLHHLFNWGRFMANLQEPHYEPGHDRHCFPKGFIRATLMGSRTALIMLCLSSLR